MLLAAVDTEQKRIFIEESAGVIICYDLSMYAAYLHNDRYYDTAYLMTMSSTVTIDALVSPPVGV